MTRLGLLIIAFILASGCSSAAKKPPPTTTTLKERTHVECVQDENTPREEVNPDFDCKEW